MRSVIAMMVMVFTLFSSPSVSTFSLGKNQVQIDMSLNVVTTPLPQQQPQLRKSAPNMPTTAETAKIQWGRLFDTNGDMKQVEKVIRVMTSWTLLISAKASALASPMYFRSLVNMFTTASALSVEQVLGLSGMGMIIGYGASRFISAIIQFFCELVLSPVTTSASASLPMEAFSAALYGASRRREDFNPNKGKGSRVSQSLDAAGGQDEGASGFARRALDRGLRASNQFLYRSIFNLLPSLIEVLCVIVLIFVKVGRSVGIVASVVAYLFVLATTTIMNKRLPILRKQLRDEGIANGYAEDALSLAETVASFGATSLEERRYAGALNNIGKSAIDVRFSFSKLKLCQSFILSSGSAAVIYAACRGLSSSNTRIVPGQLVLVSSLFAQLCAPLDHVGQHFRDCVAAAEDLREVRMFAVFIRIQFKLRGDTLPFFYDNNFPMITLLVGGHAAELLEADSNCTNKHNERAGGSSCD